MNLIGVEKSDPLLKGFMADHYSRPLSFVARSLCYLVIHEGTVYGAIVGGSATRHLPGRNEFFGDAFDLQRVINNVFYHVEPRYHNGRRWTYPLRNFTEHVLTEFEELCAEDWREKYGDAPIGFESLVELPRTGAVYRRSGWQEVGTTKGFTCKRTSDKNAQGTDSWGGARVWNRDPAQLRPKLVFCKRI